MDYGRGAVKPASGVPPPPRAAVFSWREVLDPLGRSRRVVAFAGGSSTVLRRAWHDAWRVTPVVVEGYEKPLRAFDRDRALGEVVAAGEPSAAKSRLATLDLPVPFDTGGDGRIVPSANCREHSTPLPGAACVEIASAGHLPHEERPAEFPRAIEPFLAGPSPPTS